MPGLCPRWPLAASESLVSQAAPLSSWLWTPLRVHLAPLKKTCGRIPNDRLAVEGEPRAAGEPQPAIGVERIVSTLSARRVVNDRSRRRRQAVGHLCTMAAGDAIVNVDEGHHRAADGNSGTTDGEHESWELRPGQEGTILQLEVRGGGQDVSQRNGSQDALIFF